MGVLLSRRTTGPCVALRWFDEVGRLIEQLRFDAARASLRRAEARACEAAT